VPASAIVGKMRPLLRVKDAWDTEYKREHKLRVDSEQECKNFKQKLESITGRYKVLNRNMGAPVKYSRISSRNLRASLGDDSLEREFETKAGTPEYPENKVTDLQAQIRHLEAGNAPQLLTLNDEVGRGKILDHETHNIRKEKPHLQAQTAQQSYDRDEFGVLEKVMLFPEFGRCIQILEQSHRAIWTMVISAHSNLVPSGL
jgi:hypothetical protein